jgi:hypothetical protein
LPAFKSDMAEIERIAFTHQEVVTALLKSRGIHEGLWTLYVEFGLGTAYVGPTDDYVFPTAIIPVTKIGIRPTDKVNNLSVDATSLLCTDQ